MKLFGTAATAAAIILAGYGAWTFLSRPVDAAPTAQQTVKWEKMADGSFVSRKSVEGFSNSLTRCWSSKTGFECVRAGQLSMTISLTAKDMKTLPANGDIANAGFDDNDQLIIDDHYRCETIGIGNPEETIVGHGSRLASTDDGWSKGYVTKFLADNKIDAKWFNCAALARKLEDGSYATLGTTAITRNMVFGG